MYIIPNRRKGWQLTRGCVVLCSSWKGSISRSTKNLGSKNFWVKRNFGSKKRFWKKCWFWKKILVRKKFRVWKKNFVRKKCLVWKKCWVWKEFWVQKNFGSENFHVKENCLPKFWVWKFLGKKIGSKTILAPKKCWSKKLWVKKCLDVTKFLP